MVNQKKSHLFLVVLGGKAKKANVELQFFEVRKFIKLINKK